MLWSYNKTGFGGVAQISTPIVVGDRVWFSTAYNDKTAGSGLLQIVPEGGDKFSVKAIKTLTKYELTNHHGTMILVDGYVYLGHGQMNGIPACVDIKTGELIWKADRTPPGAHGSAAYSFADGMLYIRYENRLMTLVKPSPKEDANKIVSSFMLPEANESPPRGRVGRCPSSPTASSSSAIRTSVLLQRESQHELIPSQTPHFAV